MVIDSALLDYGAPVGEWIKCDHGCAGAGGSPALGICRTRRGFVYRCHRCGEHGFIPHKDRPPHEVVKAYHHLPACDDTSVEPAVCLPADFSTRLPPKALAWLYKYGIISDEIRKYNIGYSPYLDRVILPVYGHGFKLLYWQGRSLKQKPLRKYINPTAPKNLRFDTTVFQSYLYTSTIVLVEDILSAIKVGRHAPCYGLLFSYISDDLILNRCRDFSDIVIWLDYDKRYYAAQRVGHFRNMGVPVRRVCSPCDPKVYDDENIRRLLLTNQ